MTSFAPACEGVHWARMINLS